MRRCCRFCLLLSVLPIACPVAAEELFPFVISYDAPENATNVSAWLPRPAGKDGFVRVEDGRLVTDAGPIRFWGTNLCFEACFPSHAQAERLAARLARLGINCVRMHHMDARSIWGDSPNKLTIDPKQLEKLDYLIYQLKLHGVYTDINLHVSRTLGEREGFVSPEGRPNYDKGLDNFEPQMIEVQKKYARDLLTHVNPYTETSYAREPAVAMVEISNEDALFAVWGWGQLDELPEPYATTFRRLWNAWLRQKHGDTERLRKAWNVGQWPLGDEMLVNGDFQQPPAGDWALERDARTEARLSVEPAGPDGRRCLCLDVTRQGEVAWRPQLTQSGFALKKDTPYTLTCYLRSDAPRSIDVNCMMAHDPWQRLGLSASLKLDSQWKPYRQTFVAERDDENARLTFTSLKPGRYEMAEVSLRPGGIVGLASNQRLEDDSVPVLHRGQLDLTEAARHDFIDFLWDTERDYWWGLHRFLESDLGVRPLVSGTQLSYSPAHVQAALDYIDAHSYWKHPHFPGRPWDSRDWEVHNVALVNEPGGTLSGLAVRRVAGMAFTVSEYNHPAPNSYAAEGFPMIAALGGFQRWDGIFSFAYCHNADFEPRRIGSFFDIKSDTSKLAHMPACAALLVRGDVAGARKAVLAPVSAEAERKQLHETLSAWRLTAGDFGVDPRLALRHAVAMQLDGKMPDTPLPDLDDTRVFVSDTGQLRWDVSRPGAGTFIADTPRTKLFTGFVGGRTFELGEVTLAIGKTRLDWATVSMVAIDEPAKGRTGFNGPGRILIAATGWVQNRGAQLEQLPNDRVTLRNRWGDEPVLCEGVPAQIELPVAADRVRFYPLDESGNRRAAVPCGSHEGNARLELGPRHKTVWYEVEVQ
ncbi:MAG: carbohydrate binding domain-containing protein [Pirellulales bacterium]|nr:carbohydrate binding domain-containing protein [Pirellulales bacterium]